MPREISFLMSPLKHWSQNAFQCQINSPGECREEREPQFCLPYSKWFVSCECRTEQAQQQLSEENMPTVVLGPHTVLLQHCISCSGLKELWSCPTQKTVVHHKRAWNGHTRQVKLFFTILSLSCSPSERQGQSTALNILLTLLQVTACIGM